jgi:hypothetical protein
VGSAPRQIALRHCGRAVPATAEADKATSNKRDTVSCVRGFLSFFLLFYAAPCRMPKFLLQSSHTSAIDQLATQNGMNLAALQYTYMT